MFLSNKLDQYPHLAIYLREAQKRRREIPPYVWPVFGTVAFFSILLGVGAMYFGQQLGWLAILLPFAGMAGWLWARKAQQEEVRDPLQVQGDQVAKKMSQGFEMRRLHRDLDESSLTLLEEAARHWHRVQLAVANPHWDSAAPHLIGLRDQVARAADQAMNEVLILFGPLLPDKVTSRGFLDYAEEFAEGVFHSKKTPRPVPAAFEPARIVVEKLRELANEMEHRLHRPAPEAALESAPPGLSVDLALHELRHLDRAEAELRQAPEDEDQDGLQQRLRG